VEIVACSHGNVHGENVQGEYPWESPDLVSSMSDAQGAVSEKTLKTCLPSCRHRLTALISELCVTALMYCD